MPEERTSVLVVGGALAGLSSAVFLAWHGVPCLVVERHPDLLIHPRLRGITPRTVEVYRQVGLEGAIRAASFAGDGDYRWVTARAETLASPDYAPTEEQGEEGDSGTASPCRFAPVDQDKLEILLRARAEELGAQVRFSTELTAFEQDDGGVTATIADRDGGAERTVRADYLIAADGANSPVRRRLGIPVDGPGPLFHTITALVEADLNPALRGRKLSIAYLQRPSPGTILMAHDDAGLRWVFGTGYLPRARLAGRLQRPALRRAGQGRGRPARPGGAAPPADPRHRPQGARVLDRCPAGQAVPQRAGVPGRGRRPHRAPDRRPRRQHRGPGHPQPGLEAGRRARRPGRARAAGQLPRRAAPGRRAGHGAGAGPLPVPHGPRWRRRRRAAARLPVGGARLPVSLRGRPGGSRGCGPAGAGGPGRRAGNPGAARRGRARGVEAVHPRPVRPPAGAAGRPRRRGLAGRRRPRRRPAGRALAGYRFGVELGGDGAAAAHGLEAGGALLVRPDGFVAWRSPAAAVDPDGALDRALRATLGR